MIGLALVLKPNKNKALLFTHRLLLFFQSQTVKTKIHLFLSISVFGFQYPVSTDHKLSGLASTVLLSLALAPDDCSLFEGSSPLWML